LNALQGVRLVKVGSAVPADSLSAAPQQDDHSVPVRRMDDFLLKADSLLHGSAQKYSIPDD
jgi:hypothetical protein